MIDRRSVALRVRSREDYWRAMVANGYLMPSVKSQMCTIKFFESVRKGLYWCPK